MHGQEEEVRRAQQSHRFAVAHIAGHLDEGAIVDDTAVELVRYAGQNQFELRCRGRVVSDDQIDSLKEINMRARKDVDRSGQAAEQSSQPTAQPP